MSNQTSNKCIVTLLIGSHYQQMWENLFADTWRKYAKCHGYDIVIITDYIDPNHGEKKRSPHWQKCLILEHPDVQKYRHAVWIDADILINYHRAPCIVSQTAPGKVGAVSYNALNCATPKLQANRRDREFDYSVQFGGGDHYGLGRPAEAQDIYRIVGIQTDVNDVINTGVMALETDRHANILRKVYDTRQETPLSLYEMIPLSHDLLKGDIVHFVDPRFNADYLLETLEYYPFLLLKEFQDEKRENRRIRIMAANVIWNNNFFIHCVSGAPFSRADSLWVFRDMSDWRNYIFRFKDE